MEHKRRKFGYGLVFCLVIGILFGYFNVPRLIIQTDEETKSWHVIWEGSLADAAEADPGAGASGILEVFIANHSATPSNAYAMNTSATIEGWCTAAGLGYASADATKIDIAHSTTFDIVVRVRGNHTVCWRTDKFYDTDLKVEITSADMSIAADTDCTGVISYNNTGMPYIWMNFWISDSDGGAGTGFTITKGATLEIQSIKFSAYY